MNWMNVAQPYMKPTIIKRDKNDLIIDFCMGFDIESDFSLFDKLPVYQIQPHYFVW